MSHFSEQGRKDGIYAALSAKKLILKCRTKQELANLAGRIMKSQTGLVDAFLSGDPKWQTAFFDAFLTMAEQLREDK